jgi:hypothetical protein
MESCNSNRNVVISMTTSGKFLHHAHNVIADLKGSEASKEFITIGVHPG